MHTILAFAVLAAPFAAAQAPTCSTAFGTSPVASPPTITSTALLTPPAATSTTVITTTSIGGADPTATVTSITTITLAAGTTTVPASAGFVPAQSVLTTALLRRRETADKRWGPDDHDGWSGQWWGNEAHGEQWDGRPDHSSHGEGWKPWSKSWKWQTSTLISSASPYPLPSSPPATSTPQQPGTTITPLESLYPQSIVCSTTSTLPQQTITSTSLITATSIPGSPSTTTVISTSTTSSSAQATVYGVCDSPANYAGTYNDLFFVAYYLPSGPTDTNLGTGVASARDCCIMCLETSGCNLSIYATAAAQGVQPGCHLIEGAACNATQPDANLVYTPSNAGLIGPQVIVSTSNCGSAVVAGNIGQIG